MIRGFCKSWKQLVAYYLLNSTFNEVDIQNVVQEVYNQETTEYRIKKLSYLLQI